MSVISKLYNDIYQILESLDTIETVEDFNDQYNNQDQYNNIKYPACYVEVDSIEWVQSKNNHYLLAKEPQYGNATIKVHIVIHTLDKFNREVKNKQFEIVNSVVNILQRAQCGINSGGTYTTLMRSNEEYLTPSKQLRVCVLSFTTQVTDTFEEYDDITDISGITLTLDNNYYEE